MLIQLSDRRWQKLRKQLPSDSSNEMLFNVRDKFKGKDLSDISDNNLLFLYYAYEELSKDYGKKSADIQFPMEFFTMLAEDSEEFYSKYDLTSFLIEIADKNFTDVMTPDTAMLVTAYGRQNIDMLFPTVSITGHTEVDVDDQSLKQSSNSSSNSSSSPASKGSRTYDDVYTLYIQEDTDFPEFTPVYIQAPSEKAAGKYIIDNIDQFLIFLSVMSDAEDGSELAFDIQDKIGYFQPQEVDSELLDKLRDILESYAPEDILAEFESGRYGGPELRWVHQPVVWHQV